MKIIFDRKSLNKKIKMSKNLLKIFRRIVKNHEDQGSRKLYEKLADVPGTRTKENKISKVNFQHSREQLLEEEKSTQDSRLKEYLIGSIFCVVYVILGN